MTNSANIIAIDSSNPVPAYDNSKSYWHNTAKKEKFTLVLSFFSPDGNEISMPIASISAYLKREFPWIDIHLKPVLILRDAEKYNPENFANSVAELAPDLIAFSVMSPHWYSLEPYFEALKGKLPASPILVGGYQAMLSQQQTIDNPHVDFACVGDGEYAMGSLVRFLRGEEDGPVLGMWEELNDGSVYEQAPVQTDDLAALPFPDYDIFSVNGSFNEVNTSMLGPEGLLILPVMTGRGCPYKCTYCCNTPILDGWKTKKTFLRKYDPEDMVNELIRLRDAYGVDYFEFWDELFMSNMKFVLEFFKLYKERLGLPFSINSRVEVMNEKFCQTAAEAGCHTIWFGIESGDEDYRRNKLGRKMTNQQVLDAAENCRKVGINRLTFNIAGMPFETAENMQRTLELNQAIAPEFFYFFTYIPLRGTPLYDTAKEAGLLYPITRQVTYLSGAEGGKYTLNIKEHEGGATNEEFNEVCQRMLKFQQENNRLSYEDRRSALETAMLQKDVLDASQPVEPCSEQEVKEQKDDFSNVEEISPKKVGFMSKMKKLFGASS